ncbi:glycerophosphodiester phosphodiesterase, partial [Streptomyces tricolor]
HTNPPQPSPPHRQRWAAPVFSNSPAAALAARPHARGLKVVPWTCDDPATVEALMDLGVDGIITDHPDRVRRIMADRGMPLPRSYRPHGRG